MSLTRKVAHNTFIQALGKIIGTALGMAAAVFLFRYLGDYRYGEYTTVMVYLQIFGILMDLGLFIILIKYLAKDKKELEEKNIIDNIFTFRLATGVVLLTLAAIVCWFIPQYSIIIRWGIAIAAINYLFISLSQLLTAIYQKNLNMTKVAIGEVSSKIFLFLSTISVIFIFKTGLLTIILIVSLTGFINFLILYLGILKYYKLKLAFDFRVWRDIFAESWPIALSISLNMLYFKTDTLILGWLKTQTEVGIYGATYKMMEVMITLPAMFVGLVMPVLSNSYAKRDMIKFRKVFQKSFDALIIMVAPMIAGAMVVAQPLMIFIAGEKFTSQINDLGKILQILIWAVGFIFIGTLTGYLIVIVDKQKAAIKAYAFIAATSLIGYLVLIPKFSYFGAASITVYSEATMMLFGFYFVYQVTKIMVNFKIFFRVALASLAMAFVLWLLPSWPVLITVLIGIITYALFLLLFRVLSKEEIKEIMSLKNNA